MLFAACILTSASVLADQPTNNKPVDKTAAESNDTKNKGKVYLKLASGASFAQKARVYASPAVWDLAEQGYNSELGTRPIIGGGIGYEFCSLLATDLIASYRPNFKYSKFQTTPASSAAAGNLGNKTRRFDLDVTSLMLSFYLNGLGLDQTHWKLGEKAGSLYPILGIGIGASQLKVFNFRSTGLPPVNPALDSSPSFGSENQYSIRYRFTYQALAGLEYRYNDRWALSTGYRWFDAGRFKGPEYIRDPNGIALDTENKEWRISFAAHELFVELKVFL
jgi:opacity protein-like surface antigen